MSYLDKIRELTRLSPTERQLEAIRAVVRGTGKYDAQRSVEYQRITKTSKSGTASYGSTEV